MGDHLVVCHCSVSLVSTMRWIVEGKQVFPHLARVSRFQYSIFQFQCRPQVSPFGKFLRSAFPSNCASRPSPFMFAIQTLPNRIFLPTALLSRNRDQSTPLPLSTTPSQFIKDAHRINLWSIFRDSVAFSQVGASIVRRARPCETPCSNVFLHETLTVQTPKI